jgi:hypothetical protein
MCPACVSTLGLIAAVVGSAGGLATVVVREVRKKPAAKVPSHDASARPADEEEVR